MDMTLKTHRWDAADTLETTEDIAAYLDAVLEDGAAPDESHSGHQAVEDARLRVGMVSNDRASHQHVGATRHRHQREGAQPQRTRRHLPLPGDGEGQHEGGAEPGKKEGGGLPVHVDLVVSTGISDRPGSDPLPVP